MFSYVTNIVWVLKGDKVHILCSELGNFFYLAINYCDNLKLKTSNSKFKRDIQTKQPILYRSIRNGIPKLRLFHKTVATLPGA